MMLQWHLFGSVTKYTTLGQSRGVPDEDRAELESLAFGQSDDPGFRASLQARPAAIGRMLPSGRYGLTRCLPGGPDSSGRSTFMFATFLFEANDWIVTGSQVLPNLLADTALWSRINPKEREPVQADAAWTMKNFAPDMTLAVLDAWATHRDAHRTLIAVEDTPENAAAIMGVPSTAPCRRSPPVRLGHEAAQLRRPGQSGEHPRPACPGPERRHPALRSAARARLCTGGRQLLAKRRDHP
jgi:hypothetical protein